MFADWLIGPGQKVGGYQITLPNPAGGILDRLPCRLRIVLRLYFSIIRQKLRCKLQQKLPGVTWPNKYFAYFKQL